jgi:hypothetical protein
MQGHGPVGKERLDFRNKEIALLKEITHLKLIAFQFSSLQPPTAGEKNSC